MNLKEILAGLGLAHEWLIGWNESLVHRARMEMAATFLKTEFSHMMWLDADIEFTPDDVAALWNLQTEIAVGAYQMKKTGARAYAAWKDGNLVTDLSKFEVPTSVDYAGTGFMLIAREAIERVYAHLQNQQSEVEQFLWKLAGPAPRTVREEAIIKLLIESVAPRYDSPTGTVPALFMTPIHNGILESEDYFFCRMAREAGLHIVMNPHVRLKHWGQYAYAAEPPHSVFG